MCVEGVTLSNKVYTVVREEGEHYHQPSNKVDTIADGRLVKRIDDGEVKRGEYKVYDCCNGFIKGECEGGHRFAKALLCGKEWCVDCGKWWSWAHQRRYGRWADQYYSIKEVGYMVITIPPELRENFKNKEELTAFRRFVIRMLKRKDYGKGFARWHWYGDCEYCGKKKDKRKGCRHCDFTGAGNTWHPHLNLLFDSGWMKPEEMRDIKAKILNKLKCIDAQLLDDGKPVVWYGYAQKKDVAKRVNWLEYVTRATFRRYDPKIAEAVKGYRNCVKWGKFDKVEKKHDPEICPICKTGIVWNRMDRTEWEDMESNLPREDWLPLKGGIFLWKYKLRSYDCVDHSLN